MYAPPYPLSGGAWDQPPPATPTQLPDFSLQNPLDLYMYLSNLASSTPQNAYNFYPSLPPPTNNFGPNLPIQNPNFPTQNSNANFPVQSPDMQNLILNLNQFLNSVFPPPQNSNEQLERMDFAVEKARSDLIAAGDSVSAWKVLQSALSMLQVDFWSSVGFQMQEVPSLQTLILTQGKVDAFIHCFVAVRRITSVYDLEVAICKNEGVEHFEELRLGPLLRNPLVLHYFSVDNITPVYKITSEEIISLLSEFMDTCEHTDIRVEEFLGFIVKERSVDSKEELGIRIHSLGTYISAIQDARDLESATLKRGKLITKNSKTRCTKQPLKKKVEKCVSSSINKVFCGKRIIFVSDDEVSDDESNNHFKSNHVDISSDSAKSSDGVSSGNENNELVVGNQVDSSSESTKSSDGVSRDVDLVVSPSKSKLPLLSLKWQLGEGLRTISQCVESSPFVHKQFRGKHIRFDSEDEDSNDDHVINSLVNLSSDSEDEDSNDDNVIDSLINLSSNSGRGSQRVSSCPYPSAMEERERLGLKQLSLASGDQKCNENADSLKKKRKSENLTSVSIPPKMCKRDKAEHDARAVVNGKEPNEVRNLDRRKAENLTSTVSVPQKISERDKEEQDDRSIKNGKEANEIRDLDGRKAENFTSTVSMPQRMCKRDKEEQDDRPIENGKEANEIRDLDGRKARNWPPGDWRTAPRYSHACANGFNLHALVLQSSDALLKKVDGNASATPCRKYTPISYNPGCSSSNFSKSDRLSTCTPDAIQAKETGRLGELAAFKYFVEKVGKSSVKWVNELSETRLPYDIVLEGNGIYKEFIEVKATRNPTKDWFEMSVRQLQFAVEQGEAFSIAHVILSDNNVATVRVYNNLEKLLMKQFNQEPQDQDCKLKLVVMVLEKHKEFTFVY